MNGRTSLVWRLRGSLPPPARRTVRLISDRLLWPLGSLREVQTADDYYALSFDDGPDPRWTPPLLDVLDEHNAKATFFLLSDRVEKHPRIVEDVVRRGHEIALHGDDHTRLTTLPVRVVRRRIERAKNIVEQAAGVPVCWFRPPFGAQSLPVYLAIRRIGLQIVVWGPIAEDWVDGTPREVANRAIPNIRSGSILLLHDGLVVPPGEDVPSFDRVSAFRFILQESSGQATSVGQLICYGTPHRTAWFRP